MIGLMVAAFIGCAPKVADGLDDPLGAEAPVEVDRPAGLVHDGVFTDETLGFQIPLLEGWVAEPGPSKGLMRVSMRHIPSDTRVEFWVFRGQGLEPRPREGCAWSFQTQGRANAVADEVVVATCTPTDPSSRRVFGTVFAHYGNVMQIEAHTPNEAMVEGKEAADRIIRHLRW